MWLKIGNVGYLKFFPKDRHNIWDCGNVPSNTEPPVSVEALMELPRATLRDVISTVQPGPFTNSWNKLQLADYVSANWVDVSRWYAHQSHCISVYDRDVPDDQRHPTIIEYKPPSPNSTRYAMSVGGRSDTDEDSDVDMIERMDVPDGVLAKYFDINSLDGRNLNTPAERCQMIFVKIPTINKLISSVFYLTPATCADELLETLQAVSYNVIQKDDMLLRVVGSASVVYPYESILSYCQAGGTIVIHVRLRGGVLQRKGYVKKTDRLSILVKKSKEFLSRRHEEKYDVEGLAPMPEVLKPLIEPIVQRMTTLKQSILSGQVSLKDALMNLDDARVVSLVELFEGTKKLNTELRLYRSAPLLLDDIGLLDASIPRLHNLRVELVETVIEMFAYGYTVERNSDLTYDVETFLNDLKAVQAYRQGVRRITDASLEDEASSVSGGGCEMM